MNANIDIIKYIESLKNKNEDLYNDTIEKLEKYLKKRRDNIIHNKYIDYLQGNILKAYQSALKETIDYETDHGIEHEIDEISKNIMEEINNIKSFSFSEEEEDYGNYREYTLTILLNNNKKKKIVAGIP